MGISIAGEALGGFSVGDELLGGISNGDEILWIRRLGSMFFNIKNPAFAGVTSAVTLTTSFADLISVDYTPTDADAVVGILLNMHDRGDGGDENTRPTYNLRRDTTNLISNLEIIQDPLLSDIGLAQRQLVFDKPGTTNQVSYKLTGRKTFTATSTLHEGSSLLIFEPDLQSNQDIEILSAASTSFTSTDDILSVTINVPADTSKVYLRWTVFSSAGRVLKLYHGSTEIIEIPVSAGAVYRDNFANNIEDWIHTPGSSGDQTYSLRFTSTAPGLLGSFLFASVLPD